MRRGFLHLLLFAGLVWWSVEPAAADAASRAAPQVLRVLLMVVDGSQPVPRRLRHYENTTITHVEWTEVSTLHHFAFERDTSFANLFEEMSFGQLTLVGDTVSLALPYAASDLTWTQWTALAEAQALTRGFDPFPAYDRLLYVLPHLPKNAPARGLSVGVRGWCAFIDYIELGCLFHEFGHTIGLRHAGEVQPDGTTNGLGDDSDGLMGGGFSAHVNVVNKYIAGWLGGSRLEIFDETGRAVFTIAAQSVTEDTLQAVRIVNNGARPVTGVVDTYVSFRDANGFDEQLLLSLPDHNGHEIPNTVLVHQWQRVFPGDTIYLFALAEGETYQEHGVTVEVQDISGDQATIMVRRAPYDPTAPTVVVGPTQPGSEIAGFRYYTVSIANTNDPSEVSFESRYDVTLPTIDDGWIIGWAAASAKTVAPGETGDFEFLIAPPKDVTPGTYEFSMTATDPDGDDGPVSAQAYSSYIVLPEPGFLLQLGSGLMLLTFLDRKRRRENPSPHLEPE